MRKYSLSILKIITGVVGILFCCISYGQIKTDTTVKKSLVMQPNSISPGGGYSCNVTSTPSEAYVGDTITVGGSCIPMPSVVAWNISCGEVTFNNPQQTSATIIITASCVPTLTLSTYGPTGSPGPSVTVNIYNPLIAGSFSPVSLTIAYNTSPGQLPISAPTGGKGSYTYQWQSSTDNVSWSDIAGATSGDYTPGNLTLSRIYYRRMVTSVEKTGYSNVLTINVTPPEISGSYYPSLDQNYILTRTILVPGVTSFSAVDALPSSQLRQQITYYDGLGRPMQQIAIQAAPDGKDIVTPITYDAYGRQDKSYLPYAAGGDSSGSWN